MSGDAYPFARAVLQILIRAEHSLACRRQVYPSRESGTRRALTVRAGDVIVFVEFNLFHRDVFRDWVKQIVSLYPTIDFLFNGARIKCRQFCK